MLVSSALAGLAKLAFSAGDLVAPTLGLSAVAPARRTASPRPDLRAGPGTAACALLDGAARRGAAGAERLKVCFLLYEGNMYSGGLGLYVGNLAGELVASGHDVHVIAGPPYPQLPAGVQVHPLPNYSYRRLLDRTLAGQRPFPNGSLLDPFYPLNFAELLTTRLGMYSVMGAFSIRAYQCLRELLRWHRFDVIHDNQVLGYGTLLIKAMGLPVVTTVHHPLAMDRMNRMREASSAWEQVRAVLFYPFFMQRLVAQRVDRVITVSSTSARSVARAFGLPDEKVSVVWNGVDLTTFRRLANVRRESGEILFVGRADDPNKGFRYLLLALAQLAPAVPFHLTVVQRPQSDEPRALARELGLEDRVTFLEKLSPEELVRQYNRAQLLASPSLYEGFGLPAAEALACGTPVVATTVGALPEIVDDGVSGLLVPPGEVGPLAGAIRTLLEDPERCQRMGEAGAWQVRKRLSWKRTAEETLALYREAIDGCGALAQQPARMTMRPANGAATGFPQDHRTARPATVGATPRGQK